MWNLVKFKTITKLLVSITMFVLVFCRKMPEQDSFLQRSMWSTVLQSQGMFQSYNINTSNLSNAESFGTSLNVLGQIRLD